MNEKQWEMLFQKIEKMDSRLDDINVILAKQQASLDEHVRRTLLLENRMDPIEKHVSFVNAAFKLIVGAGTLVGVYAALSKFFRGQ